MKRQMMLSMLVCTALLAGTSMAASTNVALNADVTLNGSFFTGGWADGLGYVSPASTVVDGVFLPRSTRWDQGAVWWDSHNERLQSIEIELDSISLIESFVVQADDNDSYELFYHNLTTNTWDLAWDIPIVGGYGMQTRPDPTDDSAQYVLGSPIMTDALLVMGDMVDSDKYFSVSEVQAYGHTVPAPGAFLLAGLGSGLVGYMRRRKSL